MRLPNGYGSVYKLKGNRRNPFRVTITAGYTDEGKQVRKTLGYYETRAEALNALTKYHENPYDIENSKLKFKDLYKIFLDRKINESISESSIKAYSYAYDKCSSIHDVPFIKLRTEDYMNLMSSNDSFTYSIKKKVKLLISQMYEIAMENDIVNKNYASFIKIKRSDNDRKFEKKPFTLDEIEKLFEKADAIKDCDSILIMIYSGIRIGELLKLKKKDVDLEDHSFITGIKTEAGKNRYVPIHDRIYPFFEKRMNMDHDSEYLIVGPSKDKEYHDRTYRDQFKIIMKQLDMKHTPHECRHTFATMMDNAGANKNSITKIIGHVSYTTTAKFYTHKDKEELKKAISSL